MTRSLPPADPVATALDPLVRALVRRATDDSAELVRAAEREGARAVQQARLAAETAVRDAAAKGRADGTELVAADLAAARRRARAGLLAAQSALHLRVRRVAEEAVREVLAAPGNRERLEAVLRDAVGDGGEIRDTPDGGLTAVAADGLVVDASVAALADQAVERLDLGALWTTS